MNIFYYLTFSISFDVIFILSLFILFFSKSRVFKFGNLLVKNIIYFNTSCFNSSELLKIIQVT